jgi:glycosyltransferase involved in cell wall biosynthesis
MAKVHIGMPIYNGEKYVAEAIESILNQTFEDFTLFISDDASSDASTFIAQGYAKKDSRIVYYRQSKNLGMFENFKFVLDMAGAEYFMWMAHDDVREKDYLKMCVERLNRDKTLGLATTVVTLTDTFGRDLAVENEVQILTGAPGVKQIARFIFMAEGLGKANLMYGLWRTRIAREVWNAYPQRKVWGQDYHVALALISRYPIYVEKEALFKKRLGGYSSPDLKLQEKRSVKRLSYKERRNRFPFKRFVPYLIGHREALRGTPYWPLVFILLLLVLPQSLFAYAKDRNYRKFLRSLFNAIS